MRQYLDSTARLLRALASGEAFEGVLLIAVAALAIAVANSPLADFYHGVFHGTLPWSPIAKLDTVHLWINDALMAVFFFTVGLEVKREIVSGSLADPTSRRLPVLAAIAGMAVPAAIYMFIAGSTPGLATGWAIPAATDIAFAMGMIGLLGNRVPAPLRLFLLTVAIVDDIGAVLVIALFYTVHLKLAWLAASAVVIAAMILINRVKVERIWPYALAAIVLWLCVLHSGIHATIAGVIAALTIPMRTRSGKSLVDTIEHALVGWNAYLVVPLFGFANAGVSLAGIGFDAFLAPLPLAIAAGLVLGKQAGILGCIVLAERLGIAPRPGDSSWPQIWGMSLLCGIGFTMSLFIGALAFSTQDALYEQAKLGVLAGSLVAMLGGYAVLRFAKPAAAR